MGSGSGGEVAKAAESYSKMSLSDKKTPKSLKLEPKIVKKSQNQNSAKTVKRKITPPFRARKEKKEKKVINENLGGLIFMCNAKTKPDCFRYQVMGVPTNKQALVTAIKPGFKLFLYDFDLKLMYGIYKASSSGGMKLEPPAFGGAFPFQVRFKVHKDCLPLSESVFKKAIKDNYNEKVHKLKTELTVQQVKKLTELFRPVLQLHSFVQEPQPTPIICHPPAAQSSGEATGNRRPSDHETKKFPKSAISTQREMASRDPLFLTEKEYRSYGLRRVRHISAPATAPVAPTLDPYTNGQERAQLLRNPAPLHRDVASRRDRLDPRFLSEKEYRAYGLGVQREKDYRHYGSALSDPNLTPPRMVAAHSQSFSLLTGRESYITDSNYTESDTGNHSPRGVPDDTQRLYSTYSTRLLSDYNKKEHLGGQHDLASTSVSSRYSFAGPFLSYH